METKKELEVRSFENLENFVRKPLADVLETEKEIYFLVSLPGVKKEKIEVNVENNILSLKTHNDSVPEKARPVICEYDVACFSRRFQLPNGLETSNVFASFEEGTLTIKIPKLQKTEHKVAIL